MELNKSLNKAATSETRGVPNPTNSTPPNELHAINIYDTLFILLSVPCAFSMFMLFCSIFGFAPCDIWNLAKLRVRKDILGEKGINSIPDNSEYVKKLIGLSIVLWTMDFVICTRINNFNEPLICYYLIKVIMVLSLPATLSLLFGGSFIKYLRGESSKVGKGITTLMDISGTASFVGRFAAQMMRYIFVIGKMALFLALTESAANEWAHIGGPGDTYLFEHCIPVCILIDISWLIKKACIFVVDFINVFFVLYAQIGALLIVIWWLLAALYSTAKSVWDFWRTKK